MNILYISSKKNWGGVITWMQDTALALEERGHNVYIVSNPKSAFSKEANTNLKLIKKSLGFTYNPLTILWIVNLIRKNKIELVFSNTEKEIIAGGVAAKICGIPNIRFIGNQGDFINRFRSKLCHKFVSYSITVSNFTKNAVNENFTWVDRNKIVVIYQGINFEEISAEERETEKKKLELLENAFIIGTTSRMDREKGIEYLIKAFKEVLEIKKNIRLVITGIGEDKPFFENLVNELKIEKYVLFAGFTKNPMLRASIYNIAIMPSLNENLPLALLEYLAVGCPVVSTDVGGVPEMIIEGENGLLIKPENTKQMVEKILLLMSDKNLREKISLEAKKMMTSKFSKDIMINSLEKFYNEVINEFKTKHK